jgi:hypothetical protein
MPKEVYLRDSELAFFKLGIQLVFFQPLEHLSKVFRMLLHGATINQNVVYVDDHKVIKPLSENVIHEGAKCGGCIGEAKRHHQEFVGTIPCAASGLFLIPLSNSNLVIPGA